MAKQRIKRNIDVDNAKVEFSIVENGHVVEAQVDDVFGNGTAKALSKLPNGDMAMRCLLHGMNAKFGDSAADPEKSPDPAVAIQETIDQVKGGTWSNRASGGGGRTTRTAEALSRVTGRDVAECQERLDGMSKEDKKALEDHPQVQAAMAEIKLERDQAKAEAAKAKAKDAPSLDF